jgi:hypothetical protein
MENLPPPASPSTSRKQPHAADPFNSLKLVHSRWMPAVLAQGASVNATAIDGLDANQSQEQRSKVHQNGNDIEEMR